MYHFISGYTAKVAGTEHGIAEPQATFSVAFGEPFMPLKPHIYAELLAERVESCKAHVWLVNTGWTGGPYGVGHRIPIAYTRAMIEALLDHQLDRITFHTDPIFGLSFPEACPGVPQEILEPRSTWADPGAYDLQARALAGMFVENFEHFSGQVTEEVRRAGPLEAC